jgi:putative inorganic carbon (hco3(-)) transporter
VSSLTARTQKADSPRVSAAAAAGERAGWWTSEPVVLLGLLCSLGLFYVGPGLASVLLGVALFFALTLYRPALSLAIVPLVAPLFYLPREINGKVFSPGEVAVVCGAGAWFLRDGWTIMRSRRLPNLLEIARRPAVALAAVFGLIGTAWLLVPAPEFRNLAFREFRWTVLEPIFFFALMLRWLKSERDIWRMLAAWLIGAALVGRLGAEQFFFGQTWSMEGVGRVTSVYPSATALGIYLGRPLAMALVLTVLLPREWKVWRIGSALLAFGIGLGVLFSFARGAWVGVFVGLLVVALLSRNRVMWAGIGATVLAGLALLPFVRADRITSMFRFDTPDNTGVARLSIWNAALRIIRDHPILGIGQDQLLRVDPRYEVPHIRFLVVSHPHNWVLDFWLRLGLPGLLWMVGTLVYFFWQAVRFWRANAGTALGALSLGLIAAMVDFAVHGLLDMAYFTMDNALSFWLMMGLLSLLLSTKGVPRRQAEA